MDYTANVAVMFIIQLSSHGVSQIGYSYARVIKKSDSRAISHGGGTVPLACPCAANRSVCVPSDGVSGLVKNSNSSGALLFFGGYSGSRCAANCYVVAVQLSRDPYYNHDPSAREGPERRSIWAALTNELPATLQ